MDDDNEEGGNELVFMMIPLVIEQQFYEASGVEELIVYTKRQATNKSKQPWSGGIIIGSPRAFLKGLGATSTLTKRDEGKIEIGAENELHDILDIEFEKLLNFDKSFLEGKRGWICPIR